MIPFSGRVPEEGVIRPARCGFETCCLRGWEELKERAGLPVEEGEGPTPGRTYYPEMKLHLLAPSVVSFPVPLDTIEIRIMSQSGSGIYRRWRSMHSYRVMVCATVCGTLRV